MENRICALPDDLLIRILNHLSTKEAVATAILSKRWRYVWTMVWNLEFRDSEGVGWLIDKSLQLHKAPKLWTLIVELGPRYPVDVDVGKWVENAVNRCVRMLNFELHWTAKPTSFPKSLYTCETLVVLSLSDKILVDVSSPACLPSLLHLRLTLVFYKDEDSLSTLLSGSPVLEVLTVSRHEDDNVEEFKVKSSSLRRFTYTTSWTKGEDEVGETDDERIGLLEIHAPALTDLDIYDAWIDYCWIENMPCLDVAFIDHVPNPDHMLLRSLSSVIHLFLSWTESMASCYNAIEFSRLSELYFKSNESEECLEPLMLLLQNSPKLQTLIIDTKSGGLSSSWKRPSIISGCLSTHLEHFGWIDYGRLEEERQLVRYILANSVCLKTVKISLVATCDLEERQKELESMPRISSSSQLLFSSREELKFEGPSSTFSNCYK